MPSLTISNIEPGLADRLRLSAAEHGLSIEAEAHCILQDTLDRDAPPVARPKTGADLYDRVRARFAVLGGEDLIVPPRQVVREPPRFD